MKNYVDSCFTKLEGQINKFEKTYREENENIKSNLQTMREYIEVT
jgi:hypothetical protein